jgi:hypothetical protein
MILLSLLLKFFQEPLWQWRQSLSNVTLTFLMRDGHVCQRIQLADRHGLLISSSTSCLRKSAILISAEVAVSSGRPVKGVCSLLQSWFRIPCSVGAHVWVRVLFLLCHLDTGLAMWWYIVMGVLRRFRNTENGRLCHVDPWHHSRLLLTIFPDFCR